jgi:hypothetical protein
MDEELSQVRAQLDELATATAALIALLALAVDEKERNEPAGHWVGARFSEGAAGHQLAELMARTFAIVVSPEFEATRARVWSDKS